MLAFHQIGALLMLLFGARFLMCTSFAGSIQLTFQPQAAQPGANGDSHDSAAVALQQHGCPAPSILGSYLSGETQPGTPYQNRLQAAFSGQST